MLKLPPRLLTALTTGQPLDWHDLANFYGASPQDIDEYAEALARGGITNEQICWILISRHDTLSEQEMYQYQDKLNWFWVSAKQTMSEKFIAAHSNRVHWRNISQCQVLSEAFIATWADMVVWYRICLDQRLSTQFMAQWGHKVGWKYVSACQDLSEEFILQHLYQLDLDAIHQRYPEVYERYNLDIYHRLTEVN